MKYSSLILSFFIFFQSINIHFIDVFNLPELLEHASYHKEKYGDNFFQFLSKHYGSLKQLHDVTSSDEQEHHKKLPFNHTLHNVQITSYVPNAFYDMEKWHMFFSYTCRFSYMHSLYEYLQVLAVFQPPKGA